MADTGKRMEPRNNGAEVVRRAAAETVSNAAKAAGEVARRGGDMADEMGKAAGGTLARAGDTAAEVTRRGGEAGAAVAHEALSGARSATTAAAEMAGAAGTAARQEAGAAAEGVAQVAGAMPGPMDMWRMMAGPAAAMGGMPDMQKAFGGFFGDMVRANLQIGQEMIRLANPMAIIEMQQRLVRGYLDAIVAGQALLLRSAQQSGGEALRTAERELSHQA